MSRSQGPGAHEGRPEPARGLFSAMPLVLAPFYPKLDCVFVLVLGP